MSHAYGAGARIGALGVVFFCLPAIAQDVPGIEICTVEKTMERRTSCLQSNINFLQQSLSKQSLATQQKLDSANREIESLKAQLGMLRKEFEQIRSANAGKDQKEPAKK